MTRRPPRWTFAELEADATRAADLFREERLAAKDDWARHVVPSAAEFDRLLLLLSDLQPTAMSEEGLVEAIDGGLVDALRYLAGPPVSADDLRVIARIASLAPSGARARHDTAVQIRDVLRRLIDPHRFPWVAENRAATREERAAAILASSVLMAAQRIATERRMHGKDTQEAAVKAHLRANGLREVPPGAVHTIVRGPQIGEYCGECLLGERKADVLVRLHDTRLLAVECKVSNSSTNSIKRLNNDAAVKAEYWIKQFGQSQVVPCAVLSGVFNPLNLEQAQARGLWIVWAHRLEVLSAFIADTASPR